MTEKIVAQCYADDCLNDVRSKGLCNTHYKRWRYTGKLTLTSPEELFMQRVNKKGKQQSHMDTPCWEWLGCIDKTTRYGRLEYKVDNHIIRHAHRVAFYLHHKYIPAEIIMHQCDNRKCVNPEHLTEGTQKQNMEDASQKGRMSHGEQHPYAKLSDQDIQAIRISDSPQYILANIFSVHQSTISRILNYKRRKTYAPARVETRGSGHWSSTKTKRDG